MSLDLKNIGITVGILLLSRIAEVNIISYALPVLGPIFDFSLTPTNGSI